LSEKIARKKKSSGTSDVALGKTRSNMRGRLVETDEACGTHLADCWDEITAIQDSNDMVRLNIQQTQLVIQDHFNYMYKRRAENAKRLADFLDLSVQAATDKERTRLVDVYVQEKDRLLKQEESDKKTLQQLTRTQTALASEYRQCAMQKRYSVHISVFQKFALSVRNRLHMEVTDPGILKRISEGIAQDMVEHFPVGAESDF